MSEKNVHQAVVNYLKLQYPKVLFRSDTGAGMKLTIGQAKAQKAIQNGMAWPDLFIAKPMNGWNGLFIELKDEGVKIQKKNGEMATCHLEDQLICQAKLIASGYMSGFAVGFDQAKQIIDNYLQQK